MVLIEQHHGDNPLPCGKELSPLESLQNPVTTSAPKDSHITVEHFNYTMGLLDQKMNAIYKLCRYIGVKQQEDSNLIKKLISADELSGDFWSVSFKHIYY